MKKIIRSALFNFFAIFFIASWIGGLEYQSDLKVLALASTTLALANVFLKPILKILFLPINVITLGLLGWLVNVVILYIVDVLIVGFQVVPFSINAFGSTFVFSSFLAYIGTSLALGFVTAFISWVIE